MKGPQAKRARSLAERFADLEARIDALEAKAHPVTPEEHEVAQLLNDLRGRRDHLRRRIKLGADRPEDHEAARGTAATWASTKDVDNPPGDTEGGAPKDRQNTDESEQETSDRPSPARYRYAEDQEAEAAFRELEEAYERALMRFR